MAVNDNLSVFEKPDEFIRSEYRFAKAKAGTTGMKRPFDLKEINRGAGTITLQYLDFEAEGNLYIAAGGSPDEKTVALGNGVLYAKIVKSSWTVDSIAIMSAGSYPPAPEYDSGDVNEEFPLYMYRALYLLETRGGVIQVVRDLRDAIGEGGGLPPGYTEQTLTFVLDDKIMELTVLVKDFESATVKATWDDSNGRELLQVMPYGVTDAGKLRLDLGYLKAPPA